MGENALTKGPVAARVDPSSRGAVLPAVALSLLVFALYSFYSFFQYKHFVTPSWDLGIFSQLFQAYAGGEQPIVPIKGHGFNLWGDHFHPLLIILAPFYFFFPSPATLLYVQNGLVALSVFSLYRLTQRLYSHSVALMISLAFALSFGVQQAVSVQFHEVALALPFFVKSLGHLVLAGRESGPSLQVRKAVIWALPLVFIKEDLGITVAMIGLVSLLRTQWPTRARSIMFPPASDACPLMRERAKKTGMAFFSHPAALESFLCIVWGLVWSALAVTVILPFFNTASQFDYADKIDIAAALGDPLQAMASLIYPWPKLGSLVLLVLVGAVLCLLSPLALLVLPTLVWRFLSPNEGYWESTWHYSLVLMPIVFLALLDAMEKLANFQILRTRVKKQRVGKYLPECLALLALGVALANTPFQPLSELSNPQFATFTLSAKDQAKKQVVESIPAGTVVAADLSVLTYLIPDHTVYWIGHEGEPAPDYVVIDTQGSSWGANPPQDPVAYAEDRYGAHYEVDHRFSDIYVVRKLTKTF